MRDIPGLKTVFSLFLALAPFIFLAQVMAAPGDYLYQWGADHQLQSPHAVTLDRDSNVYIADHVGMTGGSPYDETFIKKFDSSGTFVTQWGCLGYPNARIFALAFDPSGSFFLSDSETGGQVQKYDGSGKFITQFGWSGGANGDFQARGIAFDPAGNLFVADTANNRILKFNNDWSSLLAQWGGSNPGNGNGEFSSPNGVATDRNGYLLVADTLNNRIQRFNNSGEFVSEFGAADSGAGALTAPRGVAVDARGYVYVTSGNNVVMFDGYGNYITKWGGAGSGDGQLSDPQGIALNATGTAVYVADTGNRRIQVFAGIASSSIIYSAGPGGTIDGQHQQWVAPRTQVTAIPDPGYHFVIWADGTKNPTRNDYMGDSVMTATFALNHPPGNPIAGTFLFDIPLPDTSYGGLGVDHSGNLYLRQGSTLRKLGPTGTFLTSWPIADTVNGISVDACGNIYALNNYDTLQKYTNSGELVAQWGAPTNKNGTPMSPFFDPSVPIADPTCTKVYVFESHFNEWYIFDGSGAFLSRASDRSATWATFGVAPSGYLFATSYSGFLFKYDSSLNVIARFGGFGRGEGQLYLYPGGVAIDGRGNVYVGDGGNNRMEVFSDTGGYLGQWSPLGGGLAVNQSGTLVYQVLRPTLESAPVIRVTAGYGYFSLEYASGAGGSIRGAAQQAVGWDRSGTEVTAAPNPGYHFVSWSDGVANPARTENNVIADLSVTAQFAPDAVFTLRYAAGPGGVVLGATSQKVSGGGSGTPVTAVANPGYHFGCWSDGSTSATRTDSNVKGNLSLTAQFVSNITYTLKFKAGAGGTIIGVTPQFLYQGGWSAKVSAVPNAGYHFVNWTGDKGFKATADNPLIIKGATASQSITANFAINRYQVSFVAGPHGRIAGDQDQTVSHGGCTALVTAIPDRGYGFVNWTDSSNKIAGTAATLKLNNIMSDKRIQANFRKN